MVTYMFEVTMDMKHVQKSSSPMKDIITRDAANESRPGFRDKLRLIGTPKASRNDRKRRSVD
jgi:hypothetical protein